MARGHGTRGQLASITIHGGPIMTSSDKKDIRQDMILRSQKKDISQIMPLSEIYRIVSGLPPYLYNHINDHEIRAHSIYGEGEDIEPSMFINNRKGRFYCHRTGFGGGAPELIAGRKVPPHELGGIRRMIEQWARNGGCPGNHYDWTQDGEITEPQTTANLILNGVPKAWKYFRKAMEYGYPNNARIRDAIRCYLLPKVGTTLDMGPLHDYLATQLGWCELSNALVIPYGLNEVTAMELVYWMPCGKKIVMYPLTHHRASEAFQKLHTVNGDHSFFSQTKDRPKVDVKPWPAGIGQVADVPNEIILCEGVKDALIARYHGFFSVAHHGGAAQAHKIAHVTNLFFDPKNNSNRRPGHVYSIMDNDEAGREGAHKIRGEFKLINTDPVIVDIGQDDAFWKGFDLFDFFVDYEKTASDLRDILEESRGATV